MKNKAVKILICSVVFFLYVMRGGVFAWEEKAEEFMHIEFEA